MNSPTSCQLNLTNFREHQGWAIVEPRNKLISDVDRPEQYVAPHYMHLSPSTDLPYAQFGSIFTHWPSSESRIRCPLSKDIHVASRRFAMQPYTRSSTATSLHTRHRSTPNRSGAIFLPNSIVTRLLLPSFNRATGTAALFFTGDPLRTWVVSEYYPLATLSPAHDTSLRVSKGFSSSVYQMCVLWSHEFAQN